METLDKKALAILSAALVGVISVAVALSPDEPSKIDATTTRGTLSLGVATLDESTADADVPVKVDIDTRAYTAQVKEYRDQHPGTVDLLTGPVQPGESVTTGANVDLGKRAFDVQAVGGSWSIDKVTARDDDASTWIEVTATNTGADPARFVAIVQIN